MHELSVTESILEIVLRHAQQAHASRITDIHLVLGELSSIIDDSVSFYWDMLSEGTPAQGAQLHFQRVKTEMECQECGMNYQPHSSDLACPHCHSRKVKVIKGEEFFIDSIEVEVDSDITQGTAGDP